MQKNYYGKRHSPNCVCDVHFTCRACFDHIGPTPAPPGHVDPYRVPRFLKSGKRNPKWSLAVSA